MLLKEFIKKKLEQEYLGELIYNSANSCCFEVQKITVEDGGVDPQWEILLFSNLYEQVSREVKAGTLSRDSERCRLGGAESYYMTLPDNKMPEIVPPDEEDEEYDNPDLSSCEQCGEKAWDGRICHSCGMKYI